MSANCPSCGGTGEVFDVDDYIFVNCRKCNATGKIDSPSKKDLRDIWRVMRRSGNWDYLRANPDLFPVGAWEKVKARNARIMIRLYGSA